MTKMTFFQKILNAIIGRMRMVVINGTADIGAEPGFMSRIYVDKGGHLEVGEHSTIQPHVIINAGRKILIGREVMISPHCFLSDFQHDVKLSGKERMESRRFKDCIIKDGAWIGFGAVVISSRIGKNAIVGANSVVIRKDVPDHHIFIGDCRLHHRIIKKA